MTSRAINRIWALAAIIAVVVGGWAVVGAYRGDFQDNVTLYVQADRAGLALDPGAKVTRHGVRIGSVDEVAVRRGGAQITVVVDRAAARLIPANTGIEISSATVFGGKNVDVVDPPDPSTRTVADGATIGAGSVSVEINTVFATLTDLLSAVEPEKLNEILGTLGGALQGQGGKLGTSIDHLEEVLGTVNPRLDALGEVFDSAAATAKVYDDAGNDLLAVLRQLTTTATTVTDKAGDIDDLLAGTIGLASKGDEVLEPNSDRLVEAIVLLEPTAALLKKYSPMLSCFIKGVDVARTEAEKVSGGNGATMLLNSTILLGTTPYSYPADLPKVAATGGPRCGELPRVELSQVPTPYLVADTGANPFAHSTGGPQLVPQSILEFMLGGTGSGR